MLGAVNHLTAKLIGQAQMLTETDWLYRTDKDTLFDCIWWEGRGSDRKFRLLACACYRRHWHRLAQGDRTAIETLEHYADGAASAADLERTSLVDLVDIELPLMVGNSSEVREVVGYCLDRACGFAIGTARQNVNDLELNAPGGPEPEIEAFFAAIGKREREVEDTERAAQAGLFRCLFGNPFRPVTLDPAWRTPAVLALAGTIYEERRFDDLPVLADALEEAGCTTADVLGHCRGPGPHARGCWPVDLVLGKS